MSHLSNNNNNMDEKKGKQVANKNTFQKKEKQVMLVNTSKKEGEIQKGKPLGRRNN